MNRHVAFSPVAPAELRLDEGGRRHVPVQGTQHANPDLFPLGFGLALGFLGAAQFAFFTHGFLRLGTIATALASRHFLNT